MLGITSLSVECRYAECHFADCRKKVHYAERHCEVSLIVMLSAVIRNVIMQSFTMGKVVILSVIMSSVVVISDIILSVVMLNVVVLRVVKQCCVFIVEFRDAHINVPLSLLQV
jgi:hypothetical protein